MQANLCLFLLNLKLSHRGRAFQLTSRACEHILEHIEKPVKELKVYKHCETSRSHIEIYLTILTDTHERWYYKFSDNMESLTLHTLSRVKFYDSIAGLK